VSSDGKLLAAGGSDDSTLKLFNVSDGSLIRSIDTSGGAVYMTRLNPAATVAVISTADQALKVVDLATGRVTSIRAVVGYVTGVDFTADGRMMCAPVGATVEIWDARTWRQLRVLDGHAGGVTSATFSPDGSAVASTGVDGSLKLWEIPSGRLAATPGKELGEQPRARFAGDGRSVVAAGTDGGIRIYGLASDPHPVPKPAAAQPAQEDDEPEIIMPAGND